MEPNSLSLRRKASYFEEYCDGFSTNSGIRVKPRDGSALVLDSERGELVEASVRVEKKEVAQERSSLALKNHCEAERKRRARINSHLDTLRSLLPDAHKMDKASLLAKVVSNLKELERNAAEASEGLFMPMGVDELKVEQEGEALDGPPYLIKASLCCDFKPGILSDLKTAIEALHLSLMKAETATLEGRMKNVFVIASRRNEEHQEHTRGKQLLASSVHQAFRTTLNNFSASEELLLKSALPNKKRRISAFDGSLSVSSGDPW
ncbi:Putative transcription factor bHLH107 [Linum perenne]